MTESQKPLRVVGYFRVSSDAQDVDSSIATQSSRFREFAKQQGYRVIATFQDEAKSGTVDDRPGFLDMIAMARQTPKTSDAIVVTNFSRFARNKFDSAVYKQILKRCGIRVIAIEQPIEDSPEGELLESVIEAIDAYYSANLGRTIRHHIAGTAKNGFYPFRFAPFGFKKQPHQVGDKTKYTLIINEEEAVIVREAYNLYEDGNPVLKIARTFNDQGFRTRSGNKWYANSIHRMLRNPAHIGTLIYPAHPEPGRDQLHIDNHHPATISEEQFNHVQQLLTNNAPNVTHPRQVGSTHLLSRLATCNISGGTVAPRNGKGGEYHYYTCRDRKEHTASFCDCPPQRTDTVEELFMTAVLDDILTEANVTKCADIIRDEMRTQSNHQLELHDTATNELAEIDQRIERLTIAYETGKLPLDIFNKRIDVLLNQREILERTKAEVDAAFASHLRLPNNTDSAVCLAADLRQTLMQSEPAKIKPLLRSFIKQVRFDYDKFIIDYRIPLPADSAHAGQKSREVHMDDPVRPIIPLGPPSDTVRRTFRHRVRLVGKLRSTEAKSGSAEPVSVPTKPLHALVADTEKRQLAEATTASSAEPVPVPAKPLHAGIADTEKRRRNKVPRTLRTAEQKREIKRARNAAQRQRRKRLGQCSTCSNPPIEGKSRCPKCTENRKWHKRSRSR